ncbi:MAG: hypothetical protein RLZZ385_2716 [Pseudomonadota bacterium]|jgi:phosphomannomutase/phosphoglucomutase
MSEPRDDSSHCGSTTINPAIFRAYDIRGLYGSDLTEAGIHQIGLAIGSEALSQGIAALLCGRDARNSSPSLGAALMEGIRASGCDVVDLGTIHTPLLYFATFTTAWDSGVMLTASHNPAQYNGVKIVLRRASLAANQITDIHQRIQQGRVSRGQGAYRQLDLTQAYVERIAGDVRLSRKLKVVVDCANAVPALLAPRLLTTLGCEVTTLFGELNGGFPHHDPDPTQPENLQALIDAVRARGADLGIAFDGDGDRLGVVAETGEIINADVLLALLVRDIVPRHPGQPVIFDVKCTDRLAALVQQLGGVPVMHRSGHSFMKQKMQQTHAVLGGEFSAHMFILDRWYGFDDGLYTAARILEILSRDPAPASGQFAVFGRRPGTPELKIPVPEADKFALMQRIESLVDFPDARLITLDGVRAEFADGWGLVRASNTSPALLLRFEGDSDAALRRIMARFRDLLLQADGSLPINFPE